ncbi:MAG TPA: MoaD/ThiS family protein [Myxococcota bacterium]|jgi:molybdopterin converting factor small subunit
MSWLESLRSVFQREPAGSIRVHVILKGRIGEGWYDVDQQIALPAGATLATLIERAEKRGIAMRRAIAESPHLRHTLMWNGERAPVDENLARTLADGDQVYLLGPLAGG